MKAVQEEPETIWKKIGPRLYRYAPSGTYYGLIKSSGKQIRRSLDTDDLPLARRKPQDMRRDIALTDSDLIRRTPGPFGRKGNLMAFRSWLLIF